MDIENNQNLSEESEKEIKDIFKTLILNDIQDDINLIKMNIESLLSVMDRVEEYEKNKVHDSIIEMHEDIVGNYLDNIEDWESLNAFITETKSNISYVMNTCDQLNDNLKKCNDDIKNSIDINNDVLQNCINHYEKTFRKIIEDEQAFNKDNFQNILLNINDNNQNTKKGIENLDINNDYLNQINSNILIYTQESKQDIETIEKNILDTINILNTDISLLKDLVNKNNIMLDDNNKQGLEINNEMTNRLDDLQKKLNYSLIGVCILNIMLIVLIIFKSI